MIKARISIFLIVLISLTAAQDQGMLNYQNEDYEAAEMYYDSILSVNKNSSEAHFGKGASLYMKDDVKNAEIKFNESLSSAKEGLKSKAFYNLGNINYKNNNLSEALNFYKKALELNPDDDEARYNYEYIKYQKKPEEENKDEEQKEEENKDEEEKEEEKKDEENKDEEQKDEENKDEEQKDEENKNEEQKDEKKKDEESDKENEDESQSQGKEQNEKKSQDLNKAESILDALKNDEKVMQKQQLQKFKNKKLLKDW